VPTPERRPTRRAGGRGGPLLAWPVDRTAGRQAEDLADLEAATRRLHDEQRQLCERRASDTRWLTSQSTNPREAVSGIGSEVGVVVSRADAKQLAG